MMILAEFKLKLLEKNTSYISEKKVISDNNKNIESVFKKQTGTMITGLNHITLSVKNLVESFIFYKDILGLKPLMKNNKSAYFLAGDFWFCIEEDSKTRDLELPEYSHIAFSISQSDFILAVENLRRNQIKEFKINSSEGDSIYFLDPNGHKLEIHVGTWKTRLKKYLDNPDCEFYVPKTDLEDIY